MLRGGVAEKPCCLDEAAAQAAPMAAAASIIGDPALAEKVDAFRRLGGSIVFAPLDGKDFSVYVGREDACVPMCHEGFNRAQVMHLVLHGVKRPYGGPPRVTLPHGAEGAFDPFQAYTALDASNVYGYIHGRIRADDPGDFHSRCFEDVLGVPKAERIGQEHCKAAGLQLNPSDEVGGDTEEAYATLATHRTQQRAVMDSLLFTPGRLRAECGPGGRVFVFCFARATSVFLTRFLEVATVHAGPGYAADICIVALPYPDTISRAGGRLDVEAAIAGGFAAATRDDLVRIRHEEVYAFYASLLRSG